MSLLDSGGAWCDGMSCGDWMIATSTLCETNQNASENRSSQKEFHLPTINSQGRAVSFIEGIFSKSLYKKLIISGFRHGTNRYFNVNMSQNETGITD